MFEDNRGGYLVKYCDERSKERRKDVDNIEDNVVNFGKYAILVNNIPCDRNVREVVWEIDANQSSIDIIVRIFGKKWRLVDVKSRRVFISGATLGALKCVVGFNHYSSRHKKINSDLVSSKCPRCDYYEM